MIKQRWKSLSLTKKFNTVLVLFLFLIVVLALGIVLDVNKIYGESMYSVVDDNSRYLLADLDSGLRAVKDFGDYFLGDLNYQDRLSAIKDTDSMIDRIALRRSVQVQLSSVIDTVPHVVNITFVDSNGDAITAGSGFMLPSQIASQSESRADAMLGRPLWIKDIDEGYVYYLRDIRRKENIRLDHLAYLYMRVDVRSMVEDIIRKYALEALNLQIFYGDTLMYSSIDLEDFEVSEDTRFYETDHTSYYISKGDMEVSGWSYVVFNDIENISSELMPVMLISIIIFIAVISAALLVFHLMIRRTMRHMNVLDRKMSKFIEWDMDMSQFPSYEDRNDEVGHIHQHFNHIVDLFDKLVKENYVNQLAIKDNTIKMMSQQFNPHFIYNTLNSMYWLAESQGDHDVAEMSYNLANLLRVSVSSDEVNVPLRQEIQFVMNYMRIQEIRFKDRLDFRMNMESGLDNVIIPRFSVQPLIENAIKHSLEESNQVCRIILDIVRRDDIVHISVSNSGSHFPDDIKDRILNGKLKAGGSIGLVNIEERLKLIFGEGYSLEFENTSDGAVVSFSVPFEGDFT